jgi:hypothetical protein
MSKKHVKWVVLRDKIQRQVQVQRPDNNTLPESLWVKLPMELWIYP